MSAFDPKRTSGLLAPIKRISGPIERPPSEQTSSCRTKPKAACLTSRACPRGPRMGILTGREGEPMKKQEFDRRDFLKGAVIGGAAAAGGTAAMAPTPTAQAQQPATAAATAAPEAAGYEFLNLDEAAFIEALVDHMVPADEVS